MHRYGAIFDYGILHLEWPTALFIFAVFTLTMLFLNTLLFKPLIRTLEGRAAILNQGNDRLDAIEAELAAAHEAFAAAQAKMLSEISEEFQATMAAAQKQANELTDAAKKKAEQLLSTATAEIDEEMKTATEQAKDLAKELSAMIQTKVLNG